MSKVYTVAVVGGGIGRSHIVEGYLPNADRFKVIAETAFAEAQVSAEAAAAVLVNTEEDIGQLRAKIAVLTEQRHGQGRQAHGEHREGHGDDQGAAPSLLAIGFGAERNDLE